MGSVSFRLIRADRRSFREKQTCPVYSPSPIDELALQNIEEQIGEEICGEYKNFLLAQNGGAFRPAVSSALLAISDKLFFRLEFGEGGGLRWRTPAASGLGLVCRWNISF